ncbi:hypothetical protein SAMN05880501_101173 [Ureibacillus xyleni]|uniref:Uncharacterized protein n=1 Tax=Ureibacillus xyleni TaxID=614648 RepID=A0A285R8T7_9BACL|nr:hypothetical protein [Ureibacillus xyleni]SOB90515.1 hypothetical protein SAMN05880501_101173 [Ureibacillus xyleni]
MREHARIQRILSLLETIWQQQPDVRFNQLISNLQHMYSAQNEGYGKRKMKEQDFLGKEVDSSYLDFFYLEDVKWEAFLDSIVEKAKADPEATEESTNENRRNEMKDNIIAVSKLVLSNKTVDEIAEALAVSPTYVENIKAELLEGTSLEKLQKELAEYKKIRADDHE